MKDTPIRVLVISDYRDVQSCRPEAEMFIRLAAEGVRVDVLSYPDATFYNERFTKAGMRVILGHPAKKWSFSQVMKIRRLLHESNYDILHLYNSKAMLNGITAALFCPVKVLLYRGYAGHIHWYDPTAYLKYLHPSVDGIIGITRSICDELNAQIWFRKEVATYIPKGHDPAWYEHVLPAPLQPYDIPDDAIVVVFMANNRPFKDVPTLLKAADKFLSHDRLHLLMIGQGLDTMENTAFIRSMKHGHKIHFTGFIHDPLPFLKSGHIVALASTGGEGLNKSVIESMSLGLAPVITDIPGNRDLVQDHVNGRLIPPRHPEAMAEAILSLADDPKRLTELGMKAREFMQSHMHIDQTVQMTLAYYKALLHSDSKGRDTG